jgi:hypothetical protein
MAQTLSSCRVPRKSWAADTVSSAARPADILGRQVAQPGAVGGIVTLGEGDGITASAVLMLVRVGTAVAAVQ